MSAEWNQQRLQQYINDQVEESLSLEYKSAEALSKSDDAKRREISKDISAMANSAGGTIIYGISEFREDKKRHLPEKLSSIVRSEFSKEWIEQIINNIKPRIDGIVIHPVSLGNNHVAYAIEIPQSTTAHQATDFRYYKRYNFEVQPMLDHEIRDVMGRRQHPKISLNFSGTTIVVTYANSFEILGPEHRPETKHICDLKVHALNEGGVYANYVCCFLLVPKAILTEDSSKDRTTIKEDGVEYCGFNFENTTRDCTGFSTSGHPQYGPSRHEPILPSLSGYLDNIRLRSLEEMEESKKLSIRWIAHADNAPPTKGEIRLEEISFKEPRDDKNEEEE
jgi:hypothetical protein